MKGEDSVSRAELENEVRSRLFDIIIRALEAEGEQPLDVSTSEYTCPTVFSNGEEAFANIKITIPRGTRVDGAYEPYDGYFAHDDWMKELADREDKKKAREEKKAREAAEKERKKSAKKVVKTMKQDIQEVLPSQT